uniref:Ig-like domain-containing protein n=1 Tax=Astyanax mexicanus TaxID=7994 RepID=A0A3B1KC56_ASTMX
METTGTYWIKTPVVHYISTGDTVDLSCDRNHRDKTMWFGQKNNRCPFIILSAEMNSERRERPSVKFYWSYNSRFTLTWNPRNNSSTLIIRNISESDEGFYFSNNRPNDGIYRGIISKHSGFLNSVSTCQC